MDNPFWEELSIEEIAARQGITGPTDLDAWGWL